MCRHKSREDLIEGMAAFKEMFPINIGALAVASSVLLAVILVI